MNYSLTHEKFLSDFEVSRLESILQRFRSSNLRDVTLIRTALETGARAQEILNILPKDLDHERTRVFIRGLKKSSDRYIPVHLDLFDDIVTLTLGGSRPPFVVVYNTFRSIWLQYRPTKKKLHALRHTYAVRLYRETKDLMMVKHLLGHRNISNTIIYLDFALDTTAPTCLPVRNPMNSNTEASFTDFY
jgi:integrase/recombinase XerC